MSSPSADSQSFEGHNDSVLSVAFNPATPFQFATGGQDDKAFLAFSHFHHADIVNLAVAVQVKVAERRVGVVEQGLKLLKVFGLCKKFRYYLQVKPL